MSLTSLHGRLVLTPALGQYCCTFDNELSNLAILYRAFTGGGQYHREVTLLFSLKLLKVAVSHTFLARYFFPLNTLLQQLNCFQVFKQLVK